MKPISAPFFNDALVDCVLYNQAVDEACPLLAITANTSNGLSLPLRVLLLARCQNGVDENGMVGYCQVHAARALVAHVQEENFCIHDLLELLDCPRLLMSSALQLQTRDLSSFQNIEDLIFNVGILRKNNHAITRLHLSLQHVVKFP